MGMDQYLLNTIFHGMNIHFNPAKFWCEQKRATIGFDTPYVPIVVQGARHDALHAALRDQHLQVWTAPREDQGADGACGWALRMGHLEEM